MDVFQKIKQESLKELMDATLGDGQKKGRLFLYKDPITKENTPSLTYYNEDKGWWSFSSETGGDIITFYMYVYTLTKGEAVNKLKKIYNIQDDEKKQVKREAVSHKELWQNFDKYRCKGDNLLLSKWLNKRGLSDKTHVDKLAKHIGVFEGLYLKKDTYVDVLIFPCMIGGKIVGAKLRKADGTTFSGGVKSKTITGSKTGLLHGKIDPKKPVYLCEGEPDWAALVLLGFDVNQIVCNEGGASAHVKEISKLLIEADTVISMYDQDPAGLRGTNEVQKELGMDLIVPKFPRQGEAKIDVNDLYRKGFGISDFHKMISEAEKIDEPQDVIKKDNGLYVIKESDDGVKEIRITDFFLTLKDVLIYPGTNGNDDKRSLRLEIHAGNFRRTYEFKGKDIVDGRVFTSKVAEINPLISTYNINNDSLQKLIKYLGSQHKKIKETIVITHKGYIPNLDIWVTDDGVYDENYEDFFPYKMEENLIAELPNTKVLFKGDTRTRIKYEKDFYDRDILLTLFDDAEYIFNGPQGHFVLGYFVSCLFFHKLKLKLTPFPILFISGKKGSGKTTSVQMFLKCFGFDSILPESFEKSTPFIDQSDISEMGSIPLWRDEYKNNQLCTRKDGFLKTVFDRSGISKGRIDLTKVHLPINAPLILSGEEIPNDNAVFSRVCSVNIKTDRNNGDYEQIKKRSDYYGTFLVYMLNHINEVEEYYDKSFEKVKKALINQGIEKRLLNIYLPIITGITTLYKFAHKTDLENIEEQIIGEYLEIIQSKEKEEQDTDVINYFFNSLYVLYQRFDIHVYEGHIVVRDGYININFGFLYSAYKINEARSRGEVVNQQSMKKYLISELGGVQEKFYSNGSQKRGIRFKDNGKYDALTDLITFIDSKHDLVKADDNSGNLSFNINKK